MNIFIKIIISLMMKVKKEKFVLIEFLWKSFLNITNLFLSFLSKFKLTHQKILNYFLYSLNNLLNLINFILIKYDIK